MGVQSSNIPIAETEATAKSVGKAFAALVRGDANIERLWVREATDHFDVWLLTKPITHQQRLSLHGIARQLRGQFPKASVVLHIEHAGLYEVEPSQFQFAAPHGAQVFPLR